MSPVVRFHLELGPAAIKTLVASAGRRAAGKGTAGAVTGRTRQGGGGGGAGRAGWKWPERGTHPWLASVATGTGRCETDCHRLI